MTKIHTAHKVAYSSIVGQSIMLNNEDGACIAMLAIMNTEHPTEQPSVRDAARVLLDAIPQRYRIAERIHQNTDASSVGTIELALQNALRTLAQEGE